MSIALSESTWSDADLARAAGNGDTAAFEALYERHHRPLLSFSRHMLDRLHDAEDVVQHTFLAADAAFRRGEVPASVRAWLYTVARNRCVSILRARRDDQALPELDLPSAQNLAEEVEQRDDLRALLADLRMLPDDQRAALLLAELGELSHAEVAEVLGVRPRKVKALVYQARQALLAAAGARAIPCRSIREELAVATGAARRRRHLRDHVARCDGCRAYANGVASQSASLAVLLPVVPTVALRDSVLGCIGGGGTATAAGGAGAAVGVAGAAGAGGGATAVGGIGVTGAKLLAIVAIGGAAAGGGTVAITAFEDPRDGRPAARAAKPAPAPAVTGAAPRISAAPLREPGAAAPSPPRRASRGRRGAPAEKPVRDAPRSRRRDAAERRSGKPADPPGLAVAEAKRQAPSERPPKLKPETPSAARPEAPPAKPVREQSEPPAQARAAEPAAAPALPPTQAKKPDEPRGQLKQK